MRVLLVAHAFPLEDGDIAGADTFRIAEALVDRGHHVKVVAPAVGGDTGGSLLGKVAVHRVRYATPSRETLGDDGAIYAGLAPVPRDALTFAALVRALRDAITAECAAGDVQLVHALHWIPAGFAASRANRHGRPLVITVLRSDMRLARRIPGASLVMRSALKHARVVTAVSSDLARTIAAGAGVRQGDIPITLMPVAPPTPHTSEGVPHGVLATGPLTRAAGTSVLLEAVGLIKREGLPLDLTVLGDGPERVNLKAQARALGLFATFTGEVTHDALIGHLNETRVFVRPALADDDDGALIAEALMQGAPVVGTHCGAIPDYMIEEDGGRIVPPNDPNALADAIRAVATDEKYRVGASRAGHILAMRLSPAGVAERFERIYVQGRGSRAQARPSGGQ